MLRGLRLRGAPAPLLRFERHASSAKRRAAHAAFKEAQAAAEAEKAPEQASVKSIFEAPAGGRTRRRSRSRSRRRSPEPRNPRRSETMEGRRNSRSSIKGVKDTFRLHGVCKTLSDFVYGV